MTQSKANEGHASVLIEHLVIVCDAYYHAAVSQLASSPNPKAFEGFICSNADNHPVVKIRFDSDIHIDEVPGLDNHETQGFIEYAESIARHHFPNRPAYHFAELLCGSQLMLNRMKNEAEENYLYIKAGTPRGQYHLRKKTTVIAMMETQQRINDDTPSLTVINQLGATAFINPYLNIIEAALTKCVPQMHQLLSDDSASTMSFN